MFYPGIHRPPGSALTLSKTYLRVQTAFSETALDPTVHATGVAGLIPRPQTRSNVLFRAHSFTGRHWQALARASRFQISRSISLASVYIDARGPGRPRLSRYQ